MQHAALTKIDNQFKRQNPHPAYQVGDTIKIQVRIKEGENKERLQAFEGVLIGRHNKGVSETITVRKISFSVGVERIFPVHSPVIESISIVRTGRVRRAKLNYLRGLKGKAARLKERE